jgi:SlyX protein
MPVRASPQSCYVLAMEARIVDLEVRYTHLERQLDELNQVVFLQQKAIDALTKQVVDLRARLLDLGMESENEKPPHY